jgi:hypothetical protein
MRVTVAYIEAVIERMRSLDDELAHGSEDSLRDAVLQAIANNEPNAVELARAVLKTNDLDFARWRA